MQNKRYEILDGLPAYGPMYISISHDGIPFYYEGYVIQFYKSDGTIWVANFQPGVTNFSAVFDFPEFKRTIVFAFGLGYLMRDDEQKPLLVFGDGFTNVFHTSDNILIGIDQISISVFEIERDTIYNSERISWDGFKDIKLFRDCVTGFAFEPNSDEGVWHYFSFNFRTKELLGGAYNYASNNKSWWKFW